MNRAIEHIARGAKIFPLVDTCRDKDPQDYYYVHYWAYAVVRRGAISPYLFSIPGQTAIRIHDDSYMADGHWDHCYPASPTGSRSLPATTTSGATGTSAIRAESKRLRTKSRKIR